MQYDQIKYMPEGDDPSITIETEKLVAKIIDNSGLSVSENVNVKSEFGRYGVNTLVPYSHHLGYHGIRTLYDKDEKRNLVVPLASWLNLQGIRFEGIENDPVDERAWAGVGRGWPIRMEKKGKGALLTIEPLPETQFQYTVEFQPVEPDAIDFHISFHFKRKPDNGPVEFRATWPCYMNGYDDVRLFYPSGPSEKDWEWDCIGENPDIIIGETVGYEHQQKSYSVTDQAMPLGYGRIGDRVLILMFDDPSVELFMVNAGGHSAVSPIQNPAWDFKWTIEDYPLDKPVGFSGRLIYTPFKDREQILRRYSEFI